ncbi:E3 SUMO-protein ligase NSE2-like [Ptychodera flava]|uniref:E3 SUMO-protein ligase NSE2-like n=1 Tax=Ptychodera flava TaxID=63121 RepID=UPI003969C200
MANPSVFHSDVNFTVVDNAVSQLQKMNHFISTGMTACMDVALDLEESSGNQTEQIDELKVSMKEYALMEKDLANFTQAVERVKGQIKATPIEEDIDVETMLEHELSALEGANTSDANLGRHPKILELNEKLWQIKHPGETAPSQMVSVDPGDEDLMMSQATVNTKCPITQQEMVDPVQNKVCHHSYEREAILQHIAGGHGRRKCPVAGCGNKKPVDKRDLEDNSTLKHSIERRNRQATQRSSHHRK